jgi:hypothetical protein
MVGKFQPRHFRDIADEGFAFVGHHDPPYFAGATSGR